jgi:5-methyltetrahydrofolate--homocysteine methyltransferase
VYFNVGPIGDDQLADWARRNALDAAAARRALAPLLG